MTTPRPPIPSAWSMAVDNRTALALPGVGWKTVLHARTRAVPWTFPLEPGFTAPGLAPRLIQALADHEAVVRVNDETDALCPRLETLQAGLSVGAVCVQSGLQDGALHACRAALRVWCIAWNLLCQGKRLASFIQIHP